MWLCWVSSWKMSDVLDEIIKRLPPSTLKLISQYKGSYTESSDLSSTAGELLREFQQIKTTETNRELKRKIAALKSKTAENKKLILQIENELEAAKSLKKSEVKAETAVAYTEKINEFQRELDNLAKEHDNVNVVQLFKDIDDLNKEVEEYKKKISDLETLTKCYDGFPPDIEEAKEAIARLREKISKQKMGSQL